MDMDPLTAIAERRIQEAIERGEFDDLPGKGKPLHPGEDDRSVPEELRMAYRMLKNAGLLPPDVELHKEILRRSCHAEDRTMNTLRLTSQAFPDNGMIPSEYTCDGANENPPLSIRNVPVKTRSIALIVDDPDAPRGTWVHWVLWNMGPDTTEIPAMSVPGGALQGTNDFGKQNYGGPCPPSGTHRYFFKLYALDISPPLKPGATKGQLEEAMKGHILEKAELVGLYRRT